MDNNFYIYAYVRLDMNTYFYIGKGKGNRYKTINNRSNHFMNILNKVPCAVEILKDNLTEDEAFLLEVDTIYDLVFNEGYSIEIKGIKKNNNGCHLVNKTWGGEGSSGYTCSEETKKKISEANKGHKHTEETKQLWSKLRKGENHHMYGKCHSEETRKKMSENHADFNGKNHPNYGKHLSEETKKKISESNKGKLSNEANPMYGKNPLDYMTERTKEERAKKISKANSGVNNPRAIKVVSIIDGKIFACFDYIKQGAEYFSCSQGAISWCCKGKYKSCGKYNGYKIVWKYLDIIEL